MDTKTLYDALLDANIDVNDDDAIDDIEKCWFEAAMNNKEFADEWFHDFMADIEVPASLYIFRDSFKAWLDVEWLEQNKPDGTSNAALVVTAYASALTMYTSNIGARISGRIVNGTFDVVSDNLDNWINDCRGYHRDMEQARLEDAADFREGA